MYYCTAREGGLGGLASVGKHREHAGAAHHDATCGWQRALARGPHSTTLDACHRNVPSCFFRERVSTKLFQLEKAEDPVSDTVQYY